MAYTSADLTALQKAIAKGAVKLRMGEEEVTFRSLAEMRQLEAMIKRELGQASVAPTYVNPIYAGRP